MTNKRHAQTPLSSEPPQHLAAMTLWNRALGQSDIGMGRGRGRGRGRGSGGGRTDDIREEVFEPDSSEQVNNEQIQRQENNPTINEQVGGLKLGTPVLKTPDNINSPENFFRLNFFQKTSQM